MEENENEIESSIKHFFDTVVPDDATKISPWLLVLPRQQSKTETLLFFDTFSRHFTTINLPKTLQTWRCIGSCKGWLLFGDETSSTAKTSNKQKHNLVLFNPISGSKIQLPGVKSLPTRFHLSSPTSWKMLVALIFGKASGPKICRPGDRSWKTVTGDCDVVYQDILFNDDALYLLSSDSRCLIYLDQDDTVRISENDSDLIPLKRMYYSSESEPLEGSSYLVEKEGEVLLVRMQIHFNYYQFILLSISILLCIFGLIYFSMLVMIMVEVIVLVFLVWIGTTWKGIVEVFKPWNDGSYGMSRVEDLNETTMFLSSSGSVCLKNTMKVKGNVIVLVGEEGECGVFKVRDRIFIERWYRRIDMGSDLLWFSPNLWS